MSIRELEERVYETGEPAEISVLGDALASAGDPRGELIALEAAAGHPLWVARPIPQYLADYHEELADPWRDAFLGWAGPALAAQIEGGRVELRFHAGFIDARVRHGADVFAALIESRVGGALRSLEITGGDEEVRAMIAAIRRELPWLRRLVVASWRNEGPVLDLRALAPLLPRLDELSLHGHRIATAIPPRVRTLRLAGAHSLELAEPLPEVTHLDLARYPSLIEPAPLAVACRRWFPSVVRLDLSRNEPGQLALANLGGRGPDDLFFPHLAGLDMLPGLAELRLPSVRDDAAVSATRAALARLPAAARVVVARAYENRYCGLAPRCAELADDPRIERSPVFPFPSPDRMGKDALWVDGHVVGLRGAIEYLELAWAWLDEPARAAWRAFWRFLDELDYEDDDADEVIGELSRATLDAAVATCEDLGRRRYRDLQRGQPIYAPDSGTSFLWLGLLRELRKSPGGETAIIQRKWGLS